MNIQITQIEEVQKIMANKRFQKLMIFGYNF